MPCSLSDRYIQKILIFWSSFFVTPYMSVILNNLVPIRSSLSWICLLFFFSNASLDSGKINLSCPLCLVHVEKLDKLILLSYNVIYIIKCYFTSPILLLVKFRAHF